MADLADPSAANNMVIIYADDSEDTSSPDTTNDNSANSTPNTEVSPPESPFAKTVSLAESSDRKANARSLASTLSLEEQVRNLHRFQEKMEYWLKLFRFLY